MKLYCINLWMLLQVRFQSLSHALCSNSCFLLLVPFVVTILVIGSLCRLVALNSIPGALPLVVKDCVHSDVQDTLSFISTYCLCKYFEFCALLSERILHPSDVYPSGDFVVVD